MVVGFITTYAISAYHQRCECDSRSGEVYLIQHYVIKFVSDLRQVGGFLQVLRLPPPMKLTTTIYNWNIVESGIKYHHNTNPIKLQVVLNDHRKSNKCRLCIFYLISDEIYEVVDDDDDEDDEDINESIDGMLKLYL